MSAPLLPEGVPPLPGLRPVRLQGKAYYTALKQLLNDIGDDLLASAEARKRQTPDRRAFRVNDLCYLALAYRLNCKATAEFLEDRHFLPAGTYESIRGRGFRLVAALREVWATAPELWPEEGDDEL
jgi:hypothetical protein